MTNSRNNTDKKIKIKALNTEKHLLKLSYFDGFSEQLLQIELWVDLDFNYQLSYSTFQSEEVCMEGQLPQKIKSELATLIDHELTSLKTDYHIHEGATDFSSYAITINQYGEIHKFRLGAIPDESEAEIEAEVVFFKTLLTLSKFMSQQSGTEI